MKNIEKEMENHLKAMRSNEKHGKARKFTCNIEHLQMEKTQLAAKRAWSLFLAVTPILSRKCKVLAEKSDLFLAKFQYKKCRKMKNEMKRMVKA